MKRLYLIISFAIIGIVMSGCVSMSTLQTARTTDARDLVYGSAAGYIATEIDVGRDEPISVAYPMVDVYARYGITDRLDLGVRWTIPGSFMFDTKYMIYGDNSESLLAVSTGAGVGFFTLESGDWEHKMLDFMLPVYTSIHPTDWLGIYAAPKYILRRNSYTNVEENTSETGTTHFYGTSIGLKLGKDTWKNSLFFEVSYFGNSNGTPFTQAVFGVGYGIK